MPCIGAHSDHLTFRYVVTGVPAPTISKWSIEIGEFKFQIERGCPAFHTFLSRTVLSRSAQPPTGAPQFAILYIRHLENLEDSVLVCREPLKQFKSCRVKRSRPKGGRLHGW